MTFEDYAAAAGFDHSTLSNSQRSALVSGWKAEVAEGSKAQFQTEAVAAFNELRPKYENNENRHRLAALEARATAECMSRNEVELAMIREARPQGGFSVPSHHPGNLTADVIAASMLVAQGVPEKDCAGWFGPAVVDAATRPGIRGIGLQGACRLILRAHGQEPPAGRFTDEHIRTVFAISQQNIQATGAFPSTMSLPNLLSNVATKLALNSYSSVGVVWNRFCRIGSDLKDFKQAVRVRVTSDGQMKKVAPGGELKNIGIQESAYTAQPDTYGAIIGIDRRMFINDDLGMLSSAPRVLGRQGALAIERTTFTTLLANTGSFFSSGNKNLNTGAGSALSSSGLATAYQKQVERVDPNNDPILVEPRILLVPPALQTTAIGLTVSNNVIGNTTTDKPLPDSNIWANRFEPIVSPYLSVALGVSGNSDTAWYLLSPSGDFSIMEVSFVGGIMTPVIEQAAMDFQLLGLSFRGYIDFSVNFFETRGGQKNAGV